MTPTTTISTSDVSTELGKSTTVTTTFNDTDVRTLAGRPTADSEISLLMLKGRSGTKLLTVGSPIQNLNVRTTAIAAGWDGSGSVNMIIASGVYIWSDSTALPGLATSGPFPNGLTIVNNGFIMGKGGKGATGTAIGNRVGPGSAGGPAISIGSSGVTITNNSYIGGGGGGGAAVFGSGGGGAGGGDGATVRGAFATGGAIGQAGPNGVDAPPFGTAMLAGGAGGRIFPGIGGAGGTGGVRVVGKGGGAGGGGGQGSSGGFPYDGGGGGSAGNAGNDPTTNPIAAARYGYYGGAGGGGWGAAGGGAGNMGGGGAAGKAIDLQGYVVIRNGAGTTYGAVS